MFFADVLLVKKGALATIWTASHRSLSKREVVNTSVTAAVNAIEGFDTTTPLALRLNGQLLFGVTRIYGSQSQYLAADAAHAQHALSLMNLQRNNENNEKNVLAQRAAITLTGERSVFPSLDPLAGMGLSTDAVFRVSESAFGDGYTLSMSQQRLSQSDGHLERASESDLLIERARRGLNTTSLSGGAVTHREDEFDLIGGEFSLDDDLDALHASVAMEMERSALGGRSEAKNGASHLEEDFFYDDYQPDAGLHEETREPSLEVMREERSSVHPRFSLASALGLNENDVAVDMDVDQLDASFIVPIEEQKEDRAAPLNTNVEGPQVRGRNKRNRNVRFAVEQEIDDLTIISDEDFTAQLKNTRALVRDPIPNPMELPSKLTPTTINQLLNLSSSSISNDEDFVRELFSIRGLRVGPKKEGFISGVNGEEADDYKERFSSALDGTLAADQDVSVRMSEIAGAEDIDFNDEYHYDDANQAPQPIDEELGEMQQGEEEETRTGYVNMEGELMEHQRLQGEQIESTHRYITEDIVPTDQASAVGNALSTSEVQHLITNLLEKAPEPIMFNEVAGKNALRQKASSLFYQLLVLSQLGVIQCTQDDFAQQTEIKICRGQNAEQNIQGEC